MRLIPLLSLFAASHAVLEESFDIETTKNGNDGASSTHGRMLARTKRSLELKHVRKWLRSLAIKHVHAWFEDFNPVNLDPSDLTYAVKYDELLGEIKIVQWWFKLSTIFTAVNIFGVLVGGLVLNTLAIAGVTIPTKIGTWLNYIYITGAWNLAGILTVPTLYAIWAVPEQRVAYVVMLLVMWTAHWFFFSTQYWMENKLPRWIVNMISILVYGLVGWYNWYKVLFPTWTGWDSKHWP